MPQQVRGVVSHKKGEAVSVETIVIPDPGPGEAVVKIQACGVCHTDLHYREGGINDDYPFLLGHEDRKSTRLNSSHANISYAVFCLKKKIHNPFIARLMTHSAPIQL